MAEPLLKGKVAVITGGGSGIGAATGRVLAAEGARVALVDINEQGAKETAAGLGDNGLAFGCDVTREDSWSTIVESTLKRFGRVDILLNAAGTVSAESLSQTSLASLQRMWEINCIATFLGMKAVIEPMKSVGGGSIINIASGSAARATGNKFAYGTTKYAVRGMTHFAAYDLGPLIRVNCIMPGPIDTPMLRRSEFTRVGPQRGIPGLEALPLQRIGQPEEIGRAVLYLASDLSSYVTGTELFVDGGALA